MAVLGPCANVNMNGHNNIHSQLTKSLERILEDAFLSGELKLSGRKLKEFPKPVKFDLSDTVVAGKSLVFKLYLCLFARKLASVVTIRVSLCHAKVKYCALLLWIGRQADACSRYQSTKSIISLHSSKRNSRYTYLNKHGVSTFRCKILLFSGNLSLAYYFAVS